MKKIILILISLLTICELSAQELYMYIGNPCNKTGLLQSCRLRNDETRT